MGLGLGLYDCQITLLMGPRKGSDMGLYTVRISGTQLPLNPISQTFFQDEC